MSDKKIEILAAEVISRIKEIREEKGLSQYRLAELSGLSRESIRLIEKGQNSPTLISLLSITRALDTKLGEVVKEIEDR